MSKEKRFGEKYRKGAKEAFPDEICEVCGAVVEIDPESGEVHCPVCEEEEQ